IVALGFAATENVLYLFFSGYAEDGWGGLFLLFVLRVLLGAWGHAFYTSFIGIGLAMARLNRGRTIHCAFSRLGAGGAGACAAQWPGGLHCLLAGRHHRAAGGRLERLAAYVRHHRVGHLPRARLAQNLPARRSRARHHHTGAIPRCLLVARTDRRALPGALVWTPPHCTPILSALCRAGAKKHQLATLGEEKNNTLLIEQLRGELARRAPNFHI
ncbi:MAG: PrsW family intramembrane metalloprotease, partial [Blastochloris sp.]|nr:PrsW family intramembrane metalloprotease [Blastochloris sp.]